MYDSYSEVECLDTSKSMTRDEYTEFVIQRSLFLDKLKAEVARYDKIISQIDSLDSELVQAYRYKRHKVLALSKIPIESPEELEFYKWLYKGLSRVYDLLPITWQWLLTGGILVVLFLISIAAGSLFLLWTAILLGFALSRFVGASFTNGVFDRVLNARIEGAQVGRGLYNEDDEEEEAQAEAAETTESTEA